MAQFIQRTVTIANTNAASDATRLNFGPQQQIGRVFAVVPGASGSPSGRLVLARRDGKAVEAVAFLPFTATVTARRDNRANAASGNYICDVAIDGATGPSKNVLDLMGHSGDTGSHEAYEWYAEITGLDSQSSITLIAVGANKV